MDTRLKSKIFKSMFLLSVAVIIASVSISSVVLYKNVENQIIDGLKTDAELIDSCIEQYGIQDITSMTLPENVRVTIIQADGNVILDTKSYADDMENHLERPEVQDALIYGEGMAKRVSDTLSETAYYYAVKNDQNYILRVSISSDAVYNTFKTVVPVIIILGACMILVVWAVSESATGKIVKPLNQIDLNNLDNMEVYDEMSTFVAKIKSQNHIIEEQVENLKNKKLEFETITENMSEGLIVLNEAGKVISYNNSAKNLLGMTENENVSNVLVFNRSTKFEKTVYEALAGKNSECKLDILERTCQVMANTVMDGDVVKGAIVLIIDITEKEKRELLRREFSANVSHELKTPLTSISGYAEIMKSGMVKQEDTKKFAGIIFSEAKRLIDLVGDIIRISKLDEENVTLDKEKVDLVKMVDNIVKRLKKAAEEKNVSVEMNLENAEGEYSIVAVEQIVDEIIYNIVDNAIKYNKNDGKVDIKIYHDDNRIAVSVADTGIGIPEESKDRVFERFYRVDKSHSKSIGGTGLGLSIVKHGAAYLGADITLDSVEGRGTTVTIRF